MRDQYFLNPADSILSSLAFLILPTSSRGFSLKAAGLLRASPSLGTQAAGEGCSSDNKGSQVVKLQQECQASVRRKVTSAGVWGKGGLQYFPFNYHIFASNLLYLHNDWEKMGRGGGGVRGEHSAFLVLLWLYLGVKLTWKGVMVKTPQMTLRSVTADS